MFLSPWFAVAGILAAAGPVVIHLLNRQRHRIVEWAAMDFLRQAVRRSRRILRLRDLLLLALRTACVLLFGLAMARPVWDTSAKAVDPGEPLHSVLLVDNSLSMGYEELGGNLLHAAKEKAAKIVKRLPPGSRVSVVPLCALGDESSFVAYSSETDALEAIDAIEVVDRSASASAALDLAAEAIRRVPSPPSKQVVLLSDQQASNWPAEPIDTQVARLGCPVQVVPIGGDEVENAWVDDFRLQDGIADPATPAVFLATVCYEGLAPRHDVQVSLVLDGVEVAAQTVELQPGQSREIRFEGCQLDVAVEPGRPAAVTAEVSMPHDRLAGDDQRFLVVPVVAALPVVFVDQYGRDEDPARNRFGETYRLRRLLAPQTTRGGQGRQLVEIRHVRIDQLDQAVLADAPLVVVAGVSSPADTAPLLRDYVERGGALVIAAGGEFDPAAWTEAAWLDGDGILPAPLRPELVGRLPTVAGGPITPFQLDPSSMFHDDFILGQISRQELDDLYRLPYFFQAVEADLSRVERSERSPASEESSEDGPRVLARFDNRLPFMVERRIGRGQVLFVASGVWRDWNTLSATNTVLILDRIFRRMLRESLPDWNLSTSQQQILPVAADERSAEFMLHWPDGSQQPLTPDALGADRYGLSLAGLHERGIYRVAAQESAASGRRSPTAFSQKLWETPLAVNGPPEESRLEMLDEEGLGDRVGAANFRWTGDGQTVVAVALAGPQFGGREIWQWLLLAVLAALFLELLLLARPSAAGERAS